MTNNQTTTQPAPGWRFRIGIFFFAFGWLCPLFIPLVTASGLSIEWKTTISGLLLVGAPEVFSFVSIAVLGKSGFNFLKSRVLAFFKRAAPARRVSRMRYRIGLVMWAALFILGIFIYYAPALIPGYEEHRLVMNLGADSLFLASFFVLGGDCWETFRALFIYEAKAYIPETASA